MTHFYFKPWRCCIFAGTLTAVMLTGCGQGGSFSSDFSLDDVNEDVPRSTSEFGWNMFQEVLEEDSNRVISPMSISTALAMTMSGADGETREEMAEVLAMYGLDDETIAASFQSLMPFLEQTDPDVELSIANSIWKQENYGFSEDFIDRLEHSYDAQIEPLTTAEPINAWIADQTNGLIDEMIDEVKPETVMYLINAIYFYGGWTEPFNEDLTSESTFTTADGEKTEVMMMAKQDASLNYAETDDFQAVALPYGEEETWSMNIILPHEGKSVHDVIDTLKNDGEIAFSEEHMTLLLPRFTLEDDLELNDPLKALGMPQAFDAGLADFSRMTPDGGLYIDEVLHETFIEVDETGTEAAAATSVAIQETAAVIQTEMVVDRPFLFTIQDDETGTLLFIGYVNEPEE